MHTERKSAGISGGMDVKGIQKERMQEYSYEDLKQRKMRDNIILKSLEEANESGGICKYSEEQILEAQQQNAKKRINYSLDPISLRSMRVRIARTRFCVWIHCV